MGLPFQLAANFCLRFTVSQTMRSVILHKRRAERPGPFILACTHVSHVEPFLISGLVRRKIDWMARIEFFRNPFFAAALYQFDCFPVNRQGVSVSAIRTSIERLKMGRIVGIFPEGGVKTGSDLAFRGGEIKGGACLVACRARVPIVPVVILGTEKLNSIEPWKPMRRGRIWINVGREISPVIDEPHRRTARKRMTKMLSDAFISTYQELLEGCGMEDALAAPWPAAT